MQYNHTPHLGEINNTLPSPEPPTQPENALVGNPTAAEKGLRDAEEESQHATQDQLAPVAPTPKVPPQPRAGRRCPKWTVMLLTH